LKPGLAYLARDNIEVETLRKPSTGLKLADAVELDGVALGRDTQKTQHGIETHTRSSEAGLSMLSRHSENPARD